MNRRDEGSAARKRDMDAIGDAICDQAPVAVIPGTGVVARLLIDHLKRHKRRVNSLVHDERKAAWVLAGQKGREEGQVEVFGGFDYRDPETAMPGLEGCKIAYLESTVDPEWVSQTRDLIELAVAAGVRRIVRLSLFGCDVESEGFGATALGRGHHEVESFIEESGVAYTHLRPTWFYSNFKWHLDEMRAQGTLTHPFDEAQLAFVAPEDVAEAASLVLDSDDAVGRTYELTGHQRLSMAEATAILAQETGQLVRPLPVGVEEFAAWMQKSWGMGAKDVATVLDCYREAREGHTACLTQDLQGVIGRPPADFTGYVREHRLELGPWDYPATRSWRAESGGPVKSR